MLEKVQRRAINMVSNFKARNYKDKLLEAGMTSLEQRRERGDLIHIYRIMTGKDDVKSSTWFQLMTDREGGANTGAAAGHLNVLKPDNSNSEVRRNFFSQRVVQSWNSLPDGVKMSLTVNQFKNSLDDFICY
jgi:ribonuclease P/MRP protein subunit RPP40